MTNFSSKLKPFEMSALIFERIQNCLYSSENTNKKSKTRSNTNIKDETTKSGKNQNKSIRDICKKNLLKRLTDLPRLEEELKVIYNSPLYVDLFGNQRFLLDDLFDNIAFSLKNSPEWHLQLNLNIKSTSLISLPFASTPSFNKLVEQKRQNLIKEYKEELRDLENKLRNRRNYDKKRELEYKKYLKEKEVIITSFCDLYVIRREDYDKMPKYYDINLPKKYIPYSSLDYGFGYGENPQYTNYITNTYGYNFYFIKGITTDILKEHLDLLEKLDYKYIDNYEELADDDIFFSKLPMSYLTKGLELNYRYSNSIQSEEYLKQQIEEYNSLIRDCEVNLGFIKLLFYDDVRFLFSNISLLNFNIVIDMEGEDKIKITLENKYNWNVYCKIRTSLKENYLEVLGEMKGQCSKISNDVIPNTISKYVLIINKHKKSNITKEDLVRVFKEVGLEIVFGEELLI